MSLWNVDQLVQSKITATAFHIRRKEEVKSLTGWQDSYLPEFGDYFFPGDFVTESVVEHYRNILPPVRMYHGYLQPVNHISTSKTIKGFLAHVT